MDKPLQDMAINLCKAGAPWRIAYGFTMGAWEATKDLYAVSRAIDSWIAKQPRSNELAKWVEDSIG